MDIIIKRDVDNTWNKFLKYSNSSNIFQTRQWACFSLNYLNKEPLFFDLIENDKSIAKCLFLKESFMHNFFFERIFGSFIIYILYKFFPVLTTVGGPILLDNNLDVKKQFILKIINYCEVTKIKKIEIQSFPLDEADLILEKKLFEDCGFIVKVWGTFLIDLRNNKEALWNNIKKEARKLIKKTEKEGVVVEFAQDENDLREYYSLLKLHRKSLGLRTYSFDNVLQLWKNFRTKEEKNYEVLLAKKDGNLLAAMAVLVFNGNIVEIAAARSSLSMNEKIYANDLIKWRIIEWGNSLGYLTYDLGGVNPNPKTEKEDGIFKFKEKWGGKFFRYNIYTKNF